MSQKTRLGNQHPPERSEVAAYKTNILGQTVAPHVLFHSTKNKEETECFFNVSVTFPYARRQTMPRLSLDINGSKQLNAGPWCFNYSLFRGCASKKLKKHNFPVKITFCRLLQCFYSKLCDLYLKKSSVHPSVFSSVHLQRVSQGQSPVEAAELLAQGPAQHRDSQSRLQHQIQMGSKYLQEQRPHGISEKPPPVSDNPQAESFFPHLSGVSCISVLAPILFCPSSVHLISAHSHKEFI